MATLSRELRNRLERTVQRARSVAEDGASAAIQALGVGDATAPTHLTESEKILRRRLRAHGRQLGDALSKNDVQPTGRLLHEVAYEHWHRMLFARFLAENSLLIHPEHKIPLSLEECEELAREKRVDAWDLASRFATEMLPAVFRPDDPVLNLILPIETQNSLIGMLRELPAEVFLADDSLGWVYQFWQAKKKEEVNASGVKIGADELPAVTQLFTEDYMVEFLLHNTLGAWWAGRKLDSRLSQTFETEDECRKNVALPGIEWTYLRFIRDEQTNKWRPAAGVFDGWPKEAAKITLLDPCMGSGHFLVFALPILVAMRIEEEGITVAKAARRVLEDNLFGLEIDPRCSQIAAFNLALCAWKLGGYQQLPKLSLACSGLGVEASKEEWKALANESQNLKLALGQIFDLVSNAPVLGSLIDPRGSELVRSRMVSIQEVKPLLSQALGMEKVDEALANQALGVAEAIDLLSRTYTLVATNVPYLTEKRQGEILKQHIHSFFRDSKADLATAFISRCLQLADGGTIAVVSPMLWLFLDSYKALRKRLLTTTTLSAIIRLGPNAFETSNNEVVNISLAVMNPALAPPESAFVSIDVSLEMSPSVKSKALREGSFSMLEQIGMHKNPDARITTDMPGSETLLGEYAICMRGIVTGDTDKFSRKFWEVSAVVNGWRFFQSTPPGTRMGRIDEKRNLLPPFTGRENIIDWSNEGRGMLRPGTTNAAYGKPGVAVGQMGSLPVTMYSGELYDNNTAPIVPYNLKDIPALWAYCTDRAFFDEVRRIDRKMNVTSATFTKIPFNLAYWARVAEEKYPHGLPKPFSSDPTQWLFNGNPDASDQPLHVSTARLLGYRWPRLTGSNFCDCPSVPSDGLEELEDNDGVVCLYSTRGEPPAAERLHQLLAAALGRYDQSALISNAGVSGSESENLERWLQEEFCAQHYALFDHRPFILHIWDGRKDGFNAFVNYHKLSAPNGEGRRTLETLTYSYLGDWITRQRDAKNHGEEGADDRLAAALELKDELEKILSGEPPYDIFVRWKPLHEQPIGWEPDINDGVRINVRPFLMANLSRGKKGTGLFRAKPNIKWEKDRGTEPQRDKEDYPWFWGWDGSVDFMGGPEFDGNRWNDCHYTTEAKRKAREAKGR